MFSLISLIAMLAFSLAGLSQAALVVFRNTASVPICYAVEISVGTLPTNAMCNEIMPGIVVPARSNVTISASLGFIGAFTDFRNGTRGSRHEFFFDTPGHCWYDIDYEMGISNSTLGPVSGQHRVDGTPSLAGETNALAKANHAWQHILNKPQLTPHYYYLAHDAWGRGNLTNLRMDKKAPAEVYWFLQMEANMTGYVWHGSTPDNSDSVLDVERLRRLNAAADRQSWDVATQEMVITAY